MENKTAQQDVKEGASQEAEVSVDENGKQSKTTFIWVAMLILLCLQLGSYWLWNEQKTSSAKLEQQFSAVMNSSSGTSKLELSLKEVETTLQVQLSSLNLQQTSLAENVKELSERQQITRGDVEQYWALAEIEYLLNIANQRVLFAKDAIGANEALEMADARVEALDDYRLHPLRALLADEKLALSSVVKVDVEGMALKLQSALNNIDNLQVLMAPAMTDSEQESASTSENWSGALDQAWQEVKSLVVIRHQQDGAAAVLVPKQRYFLYQNLRLKLETARFALLSGQPAVLEASLKSSVQWLEQYFTGEESEAMLALLTELQSTNTTISLPDISASLAWVKGFER